jgi:hypothetical protein
MTNFQGCSNFEIYNDYYTPKYAWENISHLLPNDKIIWEAFMLNSHKSKSKQNLLDLGKNVIGDTSWDFMKTNPKYDIIVSNPPFNTQIKIAILKRLVELDKPFIIILNCCNLFCNYFNDIFKNNRKDLQIIFPKGKIHFEKLMSNGETEYKKKTPFYCIYLAYKMNIPNDKLYLD